MKKQNYQGHKDFIPNWAITLIILFVIIFGFVIVTVGWYVGTYNTIVTAKEDVATQWGNMKTEYQRRADLLQNMAEVAKSYASFEKETLIEVAKARGGSFGASKADEIAQMNSLDTILARMMTRLEQYPELKANEQYNKLMAELQNTENTIRLSRVSYNTVVRSYNIYIKKFPNNIIAGQLGYEPELFFQNSEGTEKGVELKM